MKRLSHILILFASLSTLAFSQNSVTTPEQTDTPAFTGGGCSLFPDCNYRQCCVEHDKDYYGGGTSKERFKSDNRLYTCVKNTKGWQNKFIAPVMWMGVRVFGVSFLPTPFRWGFGKTKKKSAVKIRDTGNRNQAF
ncbi:MAG: hypothetical protein WKF92_06645 [Pyrinomonadaceae bacterium]